MSAQVNWWVIAKAYFATVTYTMHIFNKCSLAVHNDFQCTLLQLYGQLLTFVMLHNLNSEIAKPESLFENTCTFLIFFDYIILQSHFSVDNGFSFLVLNDTFWIQLTSL